MTKTKLWYFEVDKLCMYIIKCKTIEWLCNYEMHGVHKTLLVDASVARV
jgi:hypothetical protein